MVPVLKEFTLNLGRGRASCVYNTIAGEITGQERGWGAALGQAPWRGTRSEL